MKKGLSRKIYKKGEEILITPAETITPEAFQSGELTKLVTELESIAKEIGAVGFSAPQIGYAKRIMMIGMEFDNPRRPNVKQFSNMTFINPQITYFSEKTDEDWEGCASFDTTLAYVSRPVTIKYKAQNASGELIEGELSNFPARVSA